MATKKHLDNLLKGIGGFGFCHKYWDTFKLPKGRHPSMCSSCEKKWREEIEMEDD